MNLAILFWFYKEPEICKNRLELIRKFNPTIPIYGLYGGDVSTVEQYKVSLGEYLDDFYVFTENKDSQWKWLQGDLLLTDWYLKRGKNLTWDTVIVVQWDMLVFGEIEKLFSMLKKDEILLSGLRPIKEVEKDWMWVTEKIPEHRQQYLTFLEYVQKTYHYKLEPLGCIFLVICLPRVFLDKYATVEQPELGFLEYRIPMYAQIFGIPFCEKHPFNAWWLDCDSLYNHNRQPIKRFVNMLRSKFNSPTLSASRTNVSLISIFRHLNSQTGARIFHPYQHLFPLRNGQWFEAFLKEFRRDFKWLNKKFFL